MYIKRNYGTMRRTLAALTFALALLGTNVAGATAFSSLAPEVPISLVSDPVDAGGHGGTLDTGIIFGRGSGARYSANLSPPVFSVCGIKGCALASSALEETSTLARASISALENSVRLLPSSRNIAGSRAWSKLIVFTSTSINVRLPIN
jgi:hypothetical protein